MTHGAVSPAELRTLFLFEALTDDQLDWLAARSEVRTYDAGAPVTREGEPATHFYVLLDGRLRLSRRMGGEDVPISESDHRGAYSGAVRAYMDEEEPYGLSVTAVTPCRFLRLPGRDFAEFVRTAFPMAVHLLDGLYVGIRNSEAQVRQREHLASLGTLSANLAHELNNPAAAAVRATSQLRTRVAGMRHKLGMVASGRIDPKVIAQLVDLQERAVERAAKADVRLSPLEASDAEDELADRLEDLGVTGGYELAPAFVAAGLDVAWLDDVARTVAPAPTEGAVRWLAYTLESEALMDELEDAATRISTLVEAVKQYSHMDSATHEEVDLHPGLDSTLVMLGAELAGVEVVRDYDRDLPPVPAYAAELNQVWTNLFVNAVQAMDHRGTLTVRTRRDGDHAVVEVADTGPGIPPEVLPRIFHAFFTTKPPGEGSGLGLDNAKRIVERRHGGRIDVDTSPAGTTFAVRLPLHADPLPQRGSTWDTASTSRS
jgi:signal transduction histidine kinase